MERAKSAAASAAWGERAPLSPAQVGAQRRRAEGQRHQRFAVGEPPEGEGVAGRQREDHRRHPRRPRREEPPEQRARPQHRRRPPEERVQVEQQRALAEEAVLPPDERAGEGPEEADAKPGIRPPGEHPPRHQHGPVGVVDEVVEVEGAPPGGEGAFGHPRMHVVVEEVRWQAQGGQVDDHPGREEEEQRRKSRDDANGCFPRFAAGRCVIESGASAGASEAPAGWAGGGVSEGFSAGFGVGFSTGSGCGGSRCDAWSVVARPLARACCVIRSTP